MMTIKGERPYVTNETHRRVKLYSGDRDLHYHEGYEEIITGAIDEKGKPKALLSLTEPQRKAIEDIAKEMGQTPEETVQDLINFSMLIYATPVTFREILVYASPLLMDRLVEYNPTIAKQIFRGLKQESEVTMKK